MNKNAIYTKLKLIILASSCYMLISADSAVAPINNRSALKLLAGDSLSMYARSLGGYSGEHEMLYVKNKTPDSLYADFEPGTILINDDSDAQDILITRQELLALKSLEKDSLKVYGYCCRAHRSAPQKDKLFSTLKRANDTLFKLAQYLNKNRYEVSAEQHAVWVVSDGNPLASIPEGVKKENVGLRKFVAKLIGKEYPWYTITYAKDTMPFSNKPERVFGEIVYQTNSICVVDIILFDDKGNKIKLLQMGMPAQPGSHSYWFDEKKILSAGKSYVVKIYYDRAVRLTHTIEL